MKNKKITNILEHLYISPLERCNLCCKMCYTKKTGNILTNSQIEDFIKRYKKEVDLKTITFCGGEVFALSDFSNLVNKLTHDNIFIQIITNGTIDKLDDFTNPNNINLIVSLDGLESYHDKNRGIGNWQKSLSFLKKAKVMGFHLEIFSIITKENLPEITLFEESLQTSLGIIPPITYHPRKPLTYLKSHPVSNISGEISGFSFISKSQREKIGKEKNIFPPLNFGCFQISLMSDSKVYGCCEGITPLGNIETDIKIILRNFKNRLKTNNYCVEPKFMCGL